MKTKRMLWKLTDRTEIWHVEADRIPRYGVAVMKCGDEGSSWMQHVSQERLYLMHVPLLCKNCLKHEVKHEDA